MAAAHHGSNSSVVECCHVMGAAASLEWLRSHEGTAEQQSTPNLIDKRIMARDEASAESGCENLLRGKERERESAREDFVFKQIAPTITLLFLRWLKS